jgi:hypothetical protein
MDTNNRPQNDQQQGAAQQGAQEKVKNPFENHQSADKDIEQAQEELEKEQQFKEALTERD